ncbi:glycoside hydrolase family 127 protein [Pseudonocardia nigra]|uniref:glycoside hydrolase family 127 protein n=1 Tax=Pseudonocardia nigra TaxID=1921578 RepID=UPI001C5F3A2F|nr:beta-L-arabinofuranosidase domain-containing protein [Pseudonocardia nigra]
MTATSARTTDTGSADASSASSARRPADPTPAARVTLRPLGLGEARIAGGFWAPRQHVNATAAITQGRARLEEAGNLENLRIAAGVSSGEPVGPIFADSDVHKWLEAVAWEYDRRPSEELLEMQREVTALVAAAQADDGYLNSVVQVRHRDRGRYFDLPWSHEHYCAGHLIQAAVAQVRCTGDTALLDVAVKLADHLAETFGEDRRHDVDGHPVIESALVELHRETGVARYLELARYFVEARGHGLMESYGKEPTYFSDRVPVREATTVEGHAVRAVYLAAGAADVAVELGDDALLQALRTQFDHMLATKAYVTGGLGSRWDWEAFGDPYELPADRAYAETCAAIGGVQWAWRMLLATGDARYADAIERMLFNGFLAGISLSGTEYFYVNPLQLRADAHPDENRSPAHGRRGWFACACCPPNVMRTLASLDGYLATRDDSGVQLHQYAPGTVTADGIALTVETEYPWDGRVRVGVDAAPGPFTLALRVPAWAEGATVTAGGATRPAEPGYVRVDATAGDVVELHLPMAVRTTTAHPRVDAVRGCVALERGPLVYAAEQADHRVPVDDLHIDADARAGATHRPDLLGGVTVVTARGSSGEEELDLTLVPYFAWANRGAGPMRVWIPRA